jgi:hypothetical protein
MARGNGKGSLMERITDCLATDVKFRRAVHPAAALFPLLEGSQPEPLDAPTPEPDEATEPPSDAPWLLKALRFVSKEGPGIIDRYQPGGTPPDVLGRAIDQAVDVMVQMKQILIDRGLWMPDQEEASDA